MDRGKIEAFFKQLDYDFTAFDLEHFIKYVEALRGRKIMCFPFPFSPGLSGVWVPGQTLDCIFFQSQTHPIHQIHIVLHELAHMLLEHPLKSVKDVLPAHMLAELNSSGVGHLRTSPINRNDDVYELEAEYLVQLIQRGVMHADRLAQLTKGGTSNAALRPYVVGLPYDARKWK